MSRITGSLPQRGGAALAAAVAALCWCAAARAEACPALPSVSRCFDVDSVWPTPRAGHFYTLPDVTSPSAQAVGLSVVGTALAEPLRVSAASPDPEGRELLVVEQRYGVTALLAYAPSSRLDTYVAASLVHQSGSGWSGLYSRAAPAWRSTGLRAARLGAEFVLARVDVPLPLLWRVGYQLVLPWGDSFARSRTFTSAPSSSLAIESGPISVATRVEWRSRSPVHVGQWRIGSELRTTLGLALTAWQPWIVPAAELWLAPSLLRQPADEGTLVSSEWLLLVGSRPQPWISVQVGLGAALPLSTHPSDLDPDTTLSAPGTPRLRGLLRVSVSYPSADAQNTRSPM